MTVHRNRVIYQSEALFISPDSTGAHFTGAAIADAATPANYANLAANVGPGPFGLFTPPKDIRQVHGGTEASPATNNAQNLVGWQEGDVWPVWNPDCVTVGTFASFAGVVEIENGTSNVQINAVNAGAAGNVLLQGDGVSTLNQLVGAQGVALNVVSGGTDIPDLGFQIQLAGGVDGVASTFQDLALPIENGTSNVQINAVNGGLAGNVLLQGDGLLTVNQLVGAQAVPLNVTSGGTDIPDAGTQIQLAGGVAGAAATFQDAALPIENGTSNVQINAVNNGIAGNVLLQGDGVSTLNQLVGAQGIALNVVSGGTDIPDAGIQIQLAGGVDATKHEFNGQALGLSDDFVVTKGLAAPNYTLTGDGTSTFDQLIAAYNLANPLTPLFVTATNGMGATNDNILVPAVGATFTNGTSNAPQTFTVVHNAGAILLNIRVLELNAGGLPVTLNGDGASTFNQLINAHNLIAGSTKLEATARVGEEVVLAAGAVVQVDGGLAGAASTFQDLALPIENGTSNVQINAVNGGLAGNVLLQGDGVSTLNQLVGGQGIALNVTSGGADIPDLGFQIQLAGGVAGAAATFQDLALPIENGTSNVQINAVNDGVAGDVLLQGDGLLTVNQLVAAQGIALNVTSGGADIPDLGFQIQLAGGVDAVTATFQDLALPIENGQSNVSIDSDERGERGNELLIGDGVSTVNALALASPVNLTVNSGGTDIPDLGANIQLAGGINAAPCAHGTIVKQLQRIQSANYGFTVTRQDVNQFGHMSRLDSIVVESPTVNLDFSYYLLDGYNERMLEFVTDGVTNALSGALSPELYQAGNNFFILTVPEARDAVNGDNNIHKAGREEEKTVISLGNGYITDYSVDVSVGAIPTASVTVEGMNIKSDFGETGNDLPAIDMRDGSYISSAWDKNAAGDRISKGALGCTGLYSLPPATSGYDGCEGSIAAALRPGDVVVDLNNAGLISKQVSGDANSPLIGSAHVQSVSISVPMGRTTLQRLGSTFGFSKALDVPMTVTMSVSALLSEIKEGNMADLLCDCTKLDVGVKIYDPECVECVTKDEGLAMSYTLKGARLESENFTSTIGDNKTVDLTFTATVGGSDDPDNGLFISGKESSDATIKGFPPSWTGLDGRENVPASGLYMGYRS